MNSVRNEISAEIAAAVEAAQNCHTESEKYEKAGTQQLHDYLKMAATALKMPVPKDLNHLTLEEKEGIRSRLSEISGIQIPSTLQEIEKLDSETVEKIAEELNRELKEQGFLSNPENNSILLLSFLNLEKAHLFTLLSQILLGFKSSFAALAPKEIVQIG